MTKSYIVLIFCSLICLGILSFGSVLFIYNSELGLGTIPFVLFSFAAWIPGTFLTALLYQIIQRKTGLAKISLNKVLLIALLINLPGMFAVKIVGDVLHVLRWGY